MRKSQILTYHHWIQRPNLWLSSNSALSFVSKHSLSVGTHATSKAWLVWLAVGQDATLPIILQRKKKGKPRAAFPSVVHRSRIYWQRRKNTPERNALQTMSTVLRHLLPQERLKDILNYVKIMFLSWIKFTEAYTDFLLGWPMILNSSESRLMFIISWPQCYCGLLIINQIRTSSCSNLI